MSFGEDAAAPITHRVKCGTKHYLSHLGRLRTLSARNRKPSFFILFEAKFLSDHGKVRTREAQHKRCPLALVDDARIHRLYFEY